MKISVIQVFLYLFSGSVSVPVSKHMDVAVSDPHPKEKETFRQDGDEDGVGEIELVGEQVSQIINGVLTGNFGQIFGGSAGFIEEEDTKTGVSTILTSVAKPLNNLLVQGVQQGQKYYNITNPPAILLHTTTTTPLPPPVQASATVPPRVIVPQNMSPVVIDRRPAPQIQVVTNLDAATLEPISPIVVDITEVIEVDVTPETEASETSTEAVPVKSAEDEDEDSDSEAKLRLK